MTRFLGTLIVMLAGMALAHVLIEGAWARGFVQGCIVGTFLINVEGDDKYTPTHWT